MNTLTTRKETGLLLRGDLVRKVMDGTKTMTRRPLDLDWGYDGGGWVEDKHGEIIPVLDVCPWGKPGDLLWVRHDFFDLVPPSTNPANYQIWDPYSSCVRWKTGEKIEGGKPHLDGWRHRPSLHLPKWAARIWLEITEVRVERIREIHRRDVPLEGIELCRHCRGYTDNNTGCNCVNRFMSSWNTIYPGSWDRNDFVWVIGFKKVESPR